MIAVGKSFRRHSVSSRADECKFLLECQCGRIHQKTSLMSSSLLLQKFPSYLAYIIWMIHKMECKWPCNCFFCRALLPGFLKNSTEHLCVVLIQLFLQVVQPYSTADMATAWKNFYFILSEKLDFHMVNNLLIMVHVLFLCMLTSLSVDEI